MDPQLKAIVERVKTAQLNPDGDDVVVDASQLLQLEILREDLESDFSEEEIFQALEAIGLDENYWVAWLEDFASYV